MGFDERRWQDLAELVAGGEVVPIVGEAAISLTNDGVTHSVAELMAQRLAERCGVTAPNSRFSLREAAARGMKAGNIPSVLKRNLKNISLEFRKEFTVDKLDPTLGLLMSISDWPLVITTSTNGFVEDSLRSQRRTEPLVIDLSQKGDLPTGWSPTSQPTLVQVFGKFSGSLGFALTDEDVLESLRDLQDKNRPDRLLDELCHRNLLFIGNCLPDWLARVFMRTMRRERLSKDRDTIKALAEDALAQESDLVLFLESLGQTWVYEGNVQTFVRRLHSAWKDVTGDRATTDEPAPYGGRTTFVPASEPVVFLSYSSQDRGAAMTAAESFRRAGLDVWFDADQLRAGANYGPRIQRSVERCVYFVPLLSRNTEADEESYFRREWGWALGRLLDLTGSSQRFIVPLVIDDLDPRHLEKVPREFLTKTVETAPQGLVPGELLAELIQELKSRRATVAQPVL